MAHCVQFLASPTFSISVSPASFIREIQAPSLKFPRISGFPVCREHGVFFACHTIATTFSPPALGS